jgi:hypothetical protein
MAWYTLKRTGPAFFHLYKRFTEMVYDNAFTPGGVAWRRLHGMALGVVILNYIEGDNRQLILT